MIPVSHGVLGGSILVDLELVMDDIHHYRSLLLGNIINNQIYSICACNLQQV
jgi:hypothetical protein